MQERIEFDVSRDFPRGLQRIDEILPLLLAPLMRQDAAPAEDVAKERSFRPQRPLAVAAVCHGN